MGQVTRRDMARWLETHGFVQEPGKATGHLHFAGPGVKINPSVVNGTVAYIRKDTGDGEGDRDGDPEDGDEQKGRAQESLGAAHRTWCTGAPATGSAHRIHLALGVAGRTVDA